MKPFLKIPVEMAQFAFTEKAINEVQTFIASHFLFNGIAHRSESAIYQIAQLLGKSERTIYRRLSWLLSNKWINKDVKGNFFFRGFDRVHKLEQWQFKRAVIMQPKDLVNIRPFLASAVMASLIKTGTGKAHRRKTARSKPVAYPLSLSIISKVLDVSLKTAFNLRKQATKCGYITNYENLAEITNLTLDELTLARQQYISHLHLKVKGYSHFFLEPPNKIKFINGGLYLQLPNQITPLIKLKNRRNLNLSRYAVN